MSEAYDSIKQGLEDALAHAEGKDVGARVHQVEVPEPDVAAIRARAGLSQAEFARSCLLYTSPSPRDKRQSRMPSSA